MSVTRKGQSIAPTASSMQIKIAKFMKKAKETLQPQQLSSMLAILTSYDSGLGILNDNLDGTSISCNIITSLEEILQSHSQLVQSINELLPEPYQIKKVITFFISVDYVLRGC